MESWKFTVDGMHEMFDSFSLRMFSLKETVVKCLLILLAYTRKQSIAIAGQKFVSPFDHNTIY